MEIVDFAALPTIVSGDCMESQNRNPKSEHACMVEFLSLLTYRLSSTFSPFN